MKSRITVFERFGYSAVAENVAFSRSRLNGEGTQPLDFEPGESLQICPDSPIRSCLVDEGAGQASGRVPLRAGEVYTPSERQVRLSPRIFYPNGPGLDPWSARDDSLSQYPHPWSLIVRRGFGLQPYSRQSLIYGASFAVGFAATDGGYLPCEGAQKLALECFHPTPSVDDALLMQHVAAHVIVSSGTDSLDQWTHTNLATATLTGATKFVVLENSNLRRDIIFVRHTVEAVPGRVHWSVRLDYTT